MIYCSFNITGTDADLRRAEAIRNQLALEQKAAVVPFLLFREQMILCGNMHDEIITFTLHLMEGCKEVRLYDSPETSVTCARDREFALKLGIPLVEVNANKTLHEKELSEILQYFAVRLGGFPPRSSFDGIAEYLNRGMSPGIVRKAIDIGVDRCNGRWNYINGILRNLLAEGIFTEEQLKARDGEKQSADRGSSTFSMELFNRALNTLPE